MTPTPGPGPARARKEREVRCANPRCRKLLGLLDGDRLRSVRLGRVWRLRVIGGDVECEACHTATPLAVDAPPAGR